MMRSYARVYLSVLLCCGFVFLFKQKTAYEMRISDWSSDVCSSDLADGARGITGISGAGRPEFPQPARQGCLLSRQQKVSGATRGGSERIFYGGENIGGCPRLSRSRYRPCTDFAAGGRGRSEEHTAELQAPMRIS